VIESFSDVPLPVTLAGASAGADYSPITDVGNEITRAAGNRQ
jgi:hypothetical protein